MLGCERVLVVNCDAAHVDLMPSGTKRDVLPERLEGNCCSEKKFLECRAPLRKRSLHNPNLWLATMGLASKFVARRRKTLLLVRENLVKNKTSGPRRTSVDAWPFDFSTDGLSCQNPVADHPRKSIEAYIFGKDANVREIQTLCSCGLRWTARVRHAPQRLHSRSLLLVRLLADSPHSFRLAFSQRFTSYPATQRAARPPPWAFNSGA